MEHRTLNRLAFNSMAVALVILLSLAVTWRVFAASRPSREETLRNALQAMAIDARERAATIAGLREQLAAARAEIQQLRRAIPVSSQQEAVRHSQEISELKQRDVVTEQNAKKAADVASDIQRRQAAGQQVLKDIHDETVYAAVTSAASVIAVVMLGGIVLVLNRKTHA